MQSHGQFISQSRLGTPAWLVLGDRWEESSDKDRNGLCSDGAWKQVEKDKHEGITKA